MKKMMILAVVAMMMLCGATTSCQRIMNTFNSVTPEEDTTAVVSYQDPVQAAIEQYLRDSIGRSYAEGDVCIPVVTIIDTDGNMGDTLRVWGDFWVFNYNLKGDTLVTVSGGNHAGLLYLNHLTDSTYKVMRFDQVADGADNLKSARDIFAERFSNYQAVVANKKERDAARINSVADYVQSHALSVKLIQELDGEVLPITSEESEQVN